MPASSKTKWFAIAFALAVGVSVGSGYAAVSSVQDALEWRAELFEVIGLRLMLCVSPLLVLVWPAGGMWLGTLFFWATGITVYVLQGMFGSAIEPLFTSWFFMFGGVLGYLYCFPFRTLYCGYLRYKARRVAHDGMCPACGYDLRATPHRCPECGTCADRTD
ncbi:MAG TPA: hypothetical protein VH370_00760 [Humisphaera sp.]|jgi:hypothetical protein|nr:hypothetical protein [Humisphaera sp.]